MFTASHCFKLLHNYYPWPVCCASWSSQCCWFIDVLGHRWIRWLYSLIRRQPTAPDFIQWYQSKRGLRAMHITFFISIIRKNNWKIFLPFHSHMLPFSALVNKNIFIRIQVYNYYSCLWWNESSWLLENQHKCFVRWWAWSSPLYSEDHVSIINHMILNWPEGFVWKMAHFEKTKKRICQNVSCNWAGIECVYVQEGLWRGNEHTPT